MSTAGNKHRRDPSLDHPASPSPADRQRRGSSTTSSRPPGLDATGQRSGQPIKPPNKQTTMNTWLRKASEQSEITQYPRAVHSRKSDIGDIHARRLQKFEDLVQKLVVSKNAPWLAEGFAAQESTHTANIVIKTMQALCSAPTLPNRNFKPLVQHVGRVGKGKYDWLHFGAKADGGNGQYYWIASVEAHLVPDAHRDNVGRRLCLALNACPVPLDLMTRSQVPATAKISKPLGLMVFEAICRTTVPGYKPRVPTPSFSVQKKDGPILVANIQLIDPATYTLFPTVKRLQVGINRQTPQYTAPPMDDTVEWMYNTKPLPMITRNGKRVYKSQIPADKVDIDEERLWGAETFMRAVTAKLHGAIMTMDEAEQAIVALKSVWTVGHVSGNVADRSTSKANFSIMERILLVLPNWAKFQFEIRIRPTIAKHFTPKVPRLHIDSVDRTRLIRPLEEFMSSWALDFDLRKAFVKLARSLDETNRMIHEGIPSVNGCNCPSADARQDHLCGRCGHAFTCSVMKPGFFGSLVCPECFSKDKGSVGLYGFMNARLYAAFWDECKLRGDDIKSSANKQRFSEIKEQIDQQLTTSTYKDMYRSATIAPGSEDRPNLPSPDAIFPYRALRDGSVWRHALGNVAVTSAGLNYAKNLWPPIFLQRLMLYLRKSQAYRQGGASDKVIEEHDLLFASECDSLVMVRLKLAVKKAKLAKARRPDPKQVAVDTDELVTGKLNTTTKFPAVPIHEHWIWQISGIWSSTRVQRLVVFVSIVEAEFGVTLCKAKDGSPGIQKDLARHLSWRAWWRLMEERLRRMQEECNRYWATTDTTTTLFCEIIFQLCVRAWKPRTQSSDKIYSTQEKTGFQKKYGLLMSTPLSLQRFHPLCLSVGKIQHGKQMITGFDDTTFQDLSRRNDARCNISIEPRWLNYMKLNYPERTYDQLKRMIFEINVPLKLADPSRQLTQIGPVEDLSNIDFDNLDLEETLVEPNMCGGFEGGDPGEIDDDFEDLLAEDSLDRIAEVDEAPPPSIDLDKIGLDRRAYPSDDTRRRLRRAVDDLEENYAPIKNDQAVIQAIMLADQTAKRNSPNSRATFEMALAELEGLKERYDVS